jgi:hypothetical protein
MLKHTVFENVIPLEVCDYIKHFFETRVDLHVYKDNNPNVIKINQPWNHLKSILEPILSNHIEITEANGGNIYKHSNVYTTHVDSFENYQMINVLLPVYLPDNITTQHFVVFDQWVNNGFGQTWYGDRVDIKNNGDFDYSKKIANIPFNDDRVHDKTTKDIDDTFYQNYLEYPSHKKEYFKGLSGKAYSFLPGNLIFFNSNQLHTTGKLTVPWKLGVHISFKGSLDKLFLKK